MDRNVESKTNTYKDIKRALTRLFTDGQWDSNAVESFRTLLTNRVNGRGPNENIAEIITGLEQDAFKIGSPTYMAMFMGSVASAKGKADLPLKQLGAYVDEEGVLQLSPDTPFSFYEEMAPDDEFLAEYSAAVHEGYPKGLARSVAADDDELGDMTKIHQFRMYLDRQNINYIRQHFDGDTDLAKLMAYDQALEAAGKECLYFGEPSRYHNKLFLGEAFQHQVNDKIETANHHSEFIVDLQTGNFVSQWDVLEQTEGKVCVPKGLSPEQQRKLLNGESFNYGADKDAHHRLDVAPASAAADLSLDYYYKQARKSSSDWKEIAKADYDETINADNYAGDALGAVTASQDESGQQDLPEAAQFEQPTETPSDEVPVESEMPIESDQEPAPLQDSLFEQPTPETEPTDAFSFTPASAEEAAAVDEATGFTAQAEPTTEAPAVFDDYKVEAPNIAAPTFAEDKIEEAPAEAPVVDETATDTTFTDTQAPAVEESFTDPTPDEAQSQNANFFSNPETSATEDPVVDDWIFDASAFEEQKREPLQGDGSIEKGSTPDFDLPQEDTLQKESNSFFGNLFGKKADKTTEIPAPEAPSFEPAGFGASIDEASAFIPAGIGATIDDASAFTPVGVEEDENEAPLGEVPVFDPAALGATIEESPVDKAPAFEPADFSTTMDEAPINEASTFEPADFSTTMDEAPINEASTFEPARFGTTLDEAPTFEPAGIGVATDEVPVPETPGIDPVIIGATIDEAPIDDTPTFEPEAPNAAIDEAPPTKTIHDFDTSFFDKKSTPMVDETAATKTEVYDPAVPQEAPAVAPGMLIKQLAVVGTIAAALIGVVTAKGMVEEEPEKKNSIANIKKSKMTIKAADYMKRQKVAAKQEVIQAKQERKAIENGETGLGAVAKRKSLKDARKKEKKAKKELRTITKDERAATKVAKEIKWNRRKEDLVDLKNELNAIKNLISEMKESKPNEKK